MASLPPRPASQRRPSPPADAAPASAAEQHEHTGLGRTRTFSATSEDSQTVLLSPRLSSQAPKDGEKDSEGKVEDSAQQAQNSPTQPDDELRTCWICRLDETDDEPGTSSEWRSPCPCVLVAHEQCLLDYIAHMEAPSASRQAGDRKGKIQCPHCKGEIRVQRPRGLVVMGVQTLEKLASTAVLPGLALFAGGVVYTSLSAIGYAQILQIFGPEEGGQLLAPLYRPPETQESWLAMRLYNALRDHWGLYLGLPMVPSMLLMSKSTYFDPIFPFLPLFFFGIREGTPNEDLLSLSWPPSAAMTVAVLPYVRSIYNEYYKRVWEPREREWLKQIQPRATESSENDGNVEIQIGEIEHDHDDDDGEIIEDEIQLEIDLDFLGNWNGGGDADNHNAEENPPVPIARGPAPPLDAPPEDEDDMPPLEPIPADNAAPAPNVPRNQPQLPADPRAARAARRQQRIVRNDYNTTSLAQSILGALLFPSVAAAVGEALKLALPKGWTTPPVSGKPTGFLQSHWGRSVVGGCMFVGLKDVVMLYVRWKMAQNHRKRRVLDYDKSKGKRSAKT